jgi:hypothetical protein
MKALKLTVGAVACASLLLAVQVGDTRDSVLAERGAPLAELKGPGADLLRYGDVTIRIRDGRVVAVEKAVAAQIVAQPAQAPIPAAAGAAPNTASGRPDEPLFPRRFVGIPEFRTTKGTHSAGTAFLARRAGDAQVFILTVHHLLGPEGGFAEPASHGQVPSLVLGIRLNELFGGAADYAVKGCVVPQGADPDGPLDDLAVFKVTGAAAQEAPALAPDRPAIGATVWVVAHVRGGVPDGEFIHRAHVTRNSEPWLWCEFENSQIITTGAGGAPVIDAAGRIVGIYSGHADEDGHKYAYLIPSTLILKTLPGP